MSKTKASGAAHYEILFIVSNRFTEDEAKQSIVKVEKLITDNGGKITLNEYWGKKKLAYPIKHETYGYYQLFEFDIERPELVKLDEKLRLDHEILRFMIITKKVKSEEQIKKEKKISDKINSKKIAEAKEKVETQKVAEKKETKAKTPAKAKVDIEDLDAKLEGILNAKDLI
jgi:small subunit ribosomal protein S6